jgi:choline dehydrogenase-like flavoprotein
MADEYDVIIIGSGAGGGTLAHRLAPSGKRVLILERGDWLPREIENWGRHRRLRRQPLRLSGHVVRPERQTVPAADPLLRRRSHEVPRRCAVSVAREGLRRAHSPRRNLARMADSRRRAPVSHEPRIQRLFDDLAGRSRRSSQTSTVQRSASRDRLLSYPPVRPTRQSCFWQAPATSTPTGLPTGRIKSGATTCSITAARSWPSPWRRTTPASRRRWE